MSLLTLDFETYYDNEFSLKKLTTEEYIRDKRFQVIGVGVKLNNEKPDWITGTHDEIATRLKWYNWSGAMVLAHNTMFDGAILNWVFGIKPKIYLDTLCMGRALYGVEVGGSLEALATREGVGKKGFEVLNAMGMRREEFTAERLALYGDYCKNDVKLTHALFTKWISTFPQQELRIIDLTLRMFVDPVLRLDKQLLQSHLQDIQDRKADLLEKSGATTEVLMSNPKFAALLRSFGVTPPTKISLATNKEAYAFAKNDEDFLALLNHPDWRVQALMHARLGTKSTLEETRTQRFISIAERGALPVPIRYYAAHTGRFGGDDKINMQNLPSRGDNAGKLKQAILAPEGYVMIDADSSQIEARVLAWLAGQDSLVEVFRKNNAEILAGVDKKDFKYDPYKLIASTIYGKPTTEITAPERFVGKTTLLGCFSEDTKVLTDAGWKRIVDVHITDTLWDGESWVTHRGVIPKGERETIRAWGIDATPEHEILTEHGWREWHEVVTNPTLSQSAFAKARSLSLTGSSISSRWANPQVGIQSYDAIVGGKDELTDITSKPSALLDAMRALKVRLMQLVKNTGGTKILSPIYGTGNDCSIVSPASFLDATQKLVRYTRTTAVEALKSMNLGARIALRSLDTLLPYLTGKMIHGISTGSITTPDTNQEIFGLQLNKKTPETSALLETCKKKLQTYDIAYAGPNNRFMIATNVGPLIVHNCGYGMGAPKFQAQLKNFGTVIDLDEARRIIDIYRSTNPAVVSLWKEAQLALVAMYRREAANLGRHNVVYVEKGDPSICLPSGLRIRYDGIKINETEKGVEFTYQTRKGPSRVYGGKIIENVCQAIARCIIAEQMLKISKRYRVVLTVHDAVACIVPEAEAEVAQKFVESCLRWVPPWAPGLPLNCESGLGRSYGDC